MKLNTLNEGPYGRRRTPEKFGSLGSLTQDGAVIGTPVYTSPEAIRLGYSGTPRPPSKLGRKPLPKFKYHDADWTGDPEMMIHSVLKYFDAKMSWVQIWNKINAELVRIKFQDSEYEVPTHDQTRDALERLFERGILRPSIKDDELVFEVV